MSQPTPYSRKFDFTNYQTQFPFNPLPGTQVDTELNCVKITSDQTLNNLKLIQRDDGQLQNRSVGCDQLKNDALTKLGCLTNTTINEFVYDISSGGVDTLTGADRNGKTLAYVVGAHISLHIDGVKADPDDITATDGINIVHATPFPNPSVVSIEIGEAEFVATVDIEKLDDISSLFNGVDTVFPITVNSQPRVINVQERATISLDDVILESVVAFTITGSNITFLTAPTAGQVFWGVNRALVVIENEGIDTAQLADGSVTNIKIALGTITEDRLAFNISSIEIGGGYDWYDDVLPATAPAGSLAFGVGQTIGKSGSGATLEDDDYEIAFDIFKKRWGNIGTEDFDNLDVVMIPDIRGTTLIVPDKLKGNISADNTVGDQAGSEDQSFTTITGSASTTASNTSGTIAQSALPNVILDQTDKVQSGGGSEAGSLMSTGSSDVSVVPSPSTSINGDVSQTSLALTIPSLTVNTTPQVTTTELILNPYTIVEKLIRLK